MKRLAFASLAALAWVGGASAQVDTRIVADTGTLGLGSNVSSTGPVTTIDGGTLAGSNLFHSFTFFDLAQGETARWVRTGGDASSIAHLISRVTGGEASRIDGTLDSTALPNADFWFINPAGILFGEGARIDVPASAHFATARELRFADGAAFTVATPGGSTFSVAAPAAFGFVGARGDIEVRGVADNLLTGVTRLTLAARNVDLIGSRVSGGDIVLAGIGAGNGAIDFDPSDPLAAPLAGRVALLASEVSSETGGDISIAGGNVRIRAGSLVSTEAFGATAGAPGGIGIHADTLRLVGSRLSASTENEHDGGAISIEARQVSIERGGTIASDSLAPCNTASCDPAGSAGAIAIKADLLRLSASADRFDPDPPTGISSDAIGLGDGGAIGIEAGALVLDGLVYIASDAFSEGRAGNVLIEADSTTLLNGALISSQTFGTGEGGLVSINGGSLLVGFESLIESGSGSPLSFPGPAGQGGLIAIDLDSLIVRDTGQIRASTFTDGDAGAIRINADAVTVENLGLISSDTIGGGGDAGAIIITAGTLDLKSGGTVGTDAFGGCNAPGCAAGGDAGSIEIEAGTMSLRSEENRASRITSDTFGDGDAGSISVRADTLILAGTIGGLADDSGAIISSQTEGSGDAGRIDLEVGRLDMDFGFVRSGASGASTGEAGNIEIRADTLFAANESAIGSETQGPGNAGAIRVEADSVRLDSLARIATSADFGASGDAGSIDIFARNFEMGLATSLASSANGSGRAGRIAVTADIILIDRLAAVSTSAGLDALAAGTIALTADTIRIDNQSLVSSSTFGAGPGGDVVIRAGRLDVTEFSQIISSAFGQGRGGAVDIEAGIVDLTMGADIASRSEEGASGDAGTVRVAADTLAVRSAAGLSSSAIGAGDAGAVRVETGLLRIEAGGIESESRVEDSGASGAIRIDADRIEIVEAGTISTRSASANPAGAILIEADSVALDGPGSEISSASDNVGGGDAGSVSIAANDIRILNGAEISTSSVAGAAGDILVLMPEDGLLRLEGLADSGVITTSSGPGTGGRITIAAPRAIISNGGSILALGESGGANVRINTQFFISSSDRPNLVAVDGSFLLEAQVGDVSRGTVERDLSVIDASGVLRGQCAAVRATGQVSQLVVRPVGPYGRARDGGGDSLPLGPCV